MSDDPKETIEAHGVRFSADEVKSVTIDRGGHEIRIETKDDEDRKIGFNR